MGTATSSVKVRSFVRSKPPLLTILRCLFYFYYFQCWMDMDQVTYNDKDLLKEVKSVHKYLMCPADLTRSHLFNLSNKQRILALLFALS